MSSRESAAPPALQSRILELVGGGADLPAAGATTVFIEAARDTLQHLLDNEQYGRDGALDLLAADALMTYAYEHAAERASATDLQAVARSGATRIGTLSMES
ncbi:MAG TPA: hypothetical protein VFV33_09840 [Gemmatimonadaceae bacterium]|nr:hypothetical protein [Gemmatimonadaceae bacterium]